MAELIYRQALNQALHEEMERDANVFLIGEEVGRDGRPTPGGGADDLELRPAGDRPDPQQRGEAAPHVWRAAAVPDRLPWSSRRRRPPLLSAFTGVRFGVFNLPRIGSG